MFFRDSAGSPPEVLQDYYRYLHLISRYKALEFEDGGIFLQTKHVVTDLSAVSGIPSTISALS